MSNSSLEAFASGEFPPQTATSHHTSKATGSDEYGTPRWLINQLLEAIPDALLTNGKMSLDPVSGAELTPIAAKRYTKRDDALIQSWYGTNVESIYLNPPYSRPEPFLDRLKQSVDPGDPQAATIGIALTKADTSTQWFHDHIAADATVICFLNRRLSFTGGDNDAAFPSALSIFGTLPNSLLETLSELGTVFTPDELTSTAGQQTLSNPTTATDAVTAIPTTPDPAASTETPLAVINSRDVLKITFDTTTLGAQNSTIPEAASVSVLPNSKHIDPETSEITIDAVGDSQAGENVCVRLQYSPTTVSHLTASVATGMGRWEVATVEELSIANP